MDTAAETSSRAKVASHHTRKNQAEAGVVQKVLELSGIEKLNPAQQSALDKGLLSDSNMVVAAPTASGKTLVAEIAALYMLRKGRKVLYIVPLKALASEKYHEFKERYGPLGYRVAISVGDLDSSDSWLSSYDIIIASTEKLDSLLRHGSPWIMDVGLVVADEIHLMDSPDRGPTLEMVLTKIRKLSSPRILALSATISNYKEIAEWLEAEPVKSDYRPVKLYTGVVYDSKANFLPKRKFEVPGKGDISDIIIDTVQRGKQALTFINTRRGTESAAEKLSAVIAKKLSGKEAEKLAELSEKIRNALENPTKQCHRLADCVKGGAAFHHAGLAAKQRKLIEDEFRLGTIKVICSTPSLSMGLNLPAYRVIIRDLKRFSSFKGMDYLSALEVQQMAGRCLAGDTIVFKDDGTPITISDMASEYFRYDETGRKKVKGKLSILSVDMNDLSIKSSSIEYLWKRKTDELLELETIGGKRIAVTKEHPVLVFNKGLSGKPRTTGEDKGELYKAAMELRRYGHGPDKIAKALGIPCKKRMIEHWLYDKSVPAKAAFEWKAAENLRKGSNFMDTDHIASAINFHRQTSQTKPTDFLSMGKLIKKGNSFMTRVGHQSCGFPSEWSIELCRFIAKIMSDGNIYYSPKDNSYQIRYYNKSREVHSEYARMCVSMFGKRVHTHWRRGSFQSEFKSFIVGSFLENIGVPPGKKSLILRVPRVIFRLPKNFIRPFLLEYSECDGYETPITRVLVTCSEKLAYDFSLLLSQIGVISRVHKKKPNKFRDRCAWEISFTKTQFHGGKKLCSVGCIHPDMIKRITTAKKPAYAYDISLNENHNFIANGLIIHNSGRPRYDTEGEAILLPKNESEAKYAWENYVKGEPEKIYSKLGVEPVLRVHVLALIASGICATRKELMDFFFRTFYAHQYKDLSALEGILDKVLAMLADFGFIEGNSSPSKIKSDNPFRPASELVSRSSDILKPTLIGRRVSELYIDPLTANHIIRHIKRAKRAGSGETAEQPRQESRCSPKAGLSADAVGFFPLLHLLCNSIEMKPLASIKKAESEEIESFAASEERSLLMDTPNSCAWEYEEFLRSIKTAMIFSDWAEELGEDSIMEKRGVSPGELHARIERMDWMLYSAQELALLLGLKDLLNPIKKARIRVKHGIREELLPLIRLKGIGRVRARKLWASNIRSIAELKKAPKNVLQRILGEKIADDVIGQLGLGNVEEEQETLLM